MSQCFFIESQVVGFRIQASTVEPIFRWVTCFRVHEKVSGEVHFQQIFMLGRTYHRTYQMYSLQKAALTFFKIYRKHLCRSLFFNKVIGPEAYNLVKKETPTQVFPYIFSLIRDSDESISYLVQNRSIIFLTMGQIRSLRLSDTLKLNLKQKTTQGNAFIKDFF